MNSGLQNKVIYSFKALSLDMLDQKGKAEQLFNMAIEEDPNDSRLYLMRGKLLYKMKQF